MNSPMPFPPLTHCCVTPKLILSSSTDVGPGDPVRRCGAAPMARRIADVHFQISLHLASPLRSFPLVAGLVIAQSGIFQMCRLPIRQRNSIAVVPSALEPSRCRQSAYGSHRLLMMVAAKTVIRASSGMPRTGSPSVALQEMSATDPGFLQG